ncbi:MAG: hypothetical protein ABH824_07080 [Nanoarchaeota archaeon]
MNKKGDLAINYIVLIALGIIVLIVVTLIFSKGASEFVTQFKGLWKEILGLKPNLS